MIVPFAFLDTSPIVATLMLKHRDTLAADGSLILRDALSGDPGADVEHGDTELLNEWKAARGLLIRLRNLIGAKTGAQPAFGKAAIFLLGPGTWLDWSIDTGPYAEAHMRLHVTLIPSDGHRLFSGDATISPAVGHVLVVDHRRPHSEVNLGSCPWVQLVVDVRRPDAPAIAVDDPVREPG